MEARQVIRGRLAGADETRMCEAAGKADHSLRIEPCSLEIGPGVTIKTLAYNGQVPGPLLRLREGVPVTYRCVNASTKADIVHWHGLAIDSLNDGAMEEGSPMIPAGQTHRYTFTPKPSGTRWYHTHAGAYGDLGIAWYLQWAVWLSAD
jgi:FtsP/CotA-like multicopper oxidase with cupredoxin domain